nr:coat protein [Botrytis cinerea ssDNA virus 1]
MISFLLSFILKMVYQNYARRNYTTGYTRKYTRRAGYSGARSGSAYRRKPTYQRRKTYTGGANIDRMATAVARRLAAQPLKVAQQPSKKVTVSADSSPITLAFNSPYMFMAPGTWAVPPERGADDGPDNRFRTSNSVHLTGIAINCMVCYDSLTRVRVVVYKPADTSCVERFATTDTSSIKETFTIRWLDNNSPALKPRGPFALEPLRRSGPYIKTEMDEKDPPGFDDLSNYKYSGIGGSVFSASLAPSGSVARPIFDKKMILNSAVGVTNMKEVKLYCKIGKTVRFNTESSTEPVDTGYQVLVFVDCPSLVDLTSDGEKKSSKHAARILGFNTTVYYR